MALAQSSQAGSSLLVVEQFAGMGGAKKALDLLGLSPLGVIASEKDKEARRVCKHASPFSW
eukprot:2484926-Karenia_brevis.AAC.1